MNTSKKNQGTFKRNWKNVSKTSIKFFSFISIISLLAFTPKPQLIHQTIESHSSDTGIKVALLLDTSNSMDGLIDQAKAQLWEIINELSYAKYGAKNPDLHIALYEYGNDGLESADGYIRQVLNFSNDLDLISEKLFSLTTNGGSEFCGQVIQTSLDELRWGKKDQDLNLIFIAGNEPFTQGSVFYKDATSNANEKNVTVNSIFCGDYQNGVSGKWKDAARQTGGDYFAIDHNQKQIYIVTPYDDIIIQLNTALNNTYIRYGAQGYSKLQAQSVQDSNAAELDEVVVVKRAVSKSSRMYTNASWDLVDAAKDKNFKYEKINKKNLSKELQGKSTIELKRYVESQAKKRQVIQEKINELNTKRKKYTIEKQAEGKNENLEKAMISTIKKQAKAKNYSW